jgi:hypothetical protein
MREVDEVFLTQMRSRMVRHAVVCDTALVIVSAAELGMMLDHIVVINEALQEAETALKSVGIDPDTLHLGR